MECRICYEKKNQFFNKLISPCNCKGSMKYIHQYCLYKYFPNKYCNICKCKFKTNIYLFFDLGLTFLMELFIINFVYFFISFYFNIIRISIISLIIFENIFIYIQINKELILSKNYILILSYAYYFSKSIISIFFIVYSSDIICYYIFPIILCIQLNIIMYYYYLLYLN